MKSQKRWIIVGVLLLILAGMPNQMLAQTQEQTQQEEERDTLENQTLLTGSAPVGTRIFCSVYTRDEEDEVTLLYQAEQQVGESGLYQITVPLPVLGRQYVLMRVGEDEELHVYNRYRKQLAKDLREYYLNVYQVMKEGS